ncbi:hypothetical protein [Haladaptatus sp. CMAA 1911]|uniref:hypothetical protein n=1 Tax=unclassified Haladaptatus TaxID=2622732 RepID=UPI00375470F1
MAQTQSSEQVAVSDVEQKQAVGQFNVNEQDDNVAASVAVGSGDDGRPDAPSIAERGDNRESGAESGDAVAIQASAQSNSNKQVAWSNAQNFNGQFQNGDDNGNGDGPQGNDGQND